MTNEEKPSIGEDISRKDLFKFAGIPTAIVAGLISLAFCLSDSSKKNCSFSTKSYGYFID